MKVDVDFASLNIKNFKRQLIQGINNNYETMRYWVYSFLLIQTLCIWTQMNNTRSNSQYLYVEYQNESYSINFQNAFQSGDQSKIKVLIGINSFVNPIINNRYLVVSYSTETLNNFILLTDSGYPYARHCTIRYLAFMQNFKYVLQHQILAPNPPSQLSKSQSNSYLTPDHIGVLWITGYNLYFVNSVHYQSVDLTLQISQILLHSYKIKISYSYSEIAFETIYYNALFFKLSEISQNESNFVSWGWIAVNIQQIQNSTSSLPVKTILTGINSLHMVNGSDCLFNLSISLKITQGTSCFRDNLLGTNYSYINIGTNCLISCNSQNSLEWKLCDKNYLNLTHFRPCHCPDPSYFSETVYYSWKTCLQIPYIQQQQMGKCRCIDELGKCSMQLDIDCNITRCYFQAQFGNIVIDSVKKNQTQNIVYFTGRISLLEGIFIKGANISNVMDFNGKADCCIIDWELFSDNNTFSGNITYSEHIHIQNLTASIIFSKFNHTQFGYNIFEYSKTLKFDEQIIPQNGLLAHWYTESVYNQAVIIRYVIYFILGIVGVNVILGFANRYSIVSLQMIEVVQIAYFGLPLAGFYRSPLIVSLKYLKYINGYNFDINPTDKVSELNLLGSGIFITPFENINVMFGLIGIPLLVSFLLFILSFLNKMQKSTYRIKALFMLGQYLLLFLIFLIYPAAFNLGLLIMNLENIINKQFLTFSCIQLGFFFLILTVVSVIYTLTNYNVFGEFKYLFKSSKFASNYYYLIPVGQRVIIGFALGILNYSYISAVIGIIMLLGTGVVVLITKPYAEVCSNERMTINQILSTLILSTYIFLNFKQQTTSELALYSPYLILSLVLISSGLSLTFTVKRTINNILKYKQQQKLSNAFRIEQSLKQKQINNQLILTLEEGLTIRSGENTLKRMLYKKYKRKKTRTQSLFQRNSSFAGQISYSNDDDGLTPNRILMVDEMLRNGDI